MTQSEIHKKIESLGLELEFECPEAAIVLLTLAGTVALDNRRILHCFARYSVAFGKRIPVGIDEARLREMG